MSLYNIKGLFGQNPGPDNFHQAADVIPGTQVLIGSCHPGSVPDVQFWMPRAVMAAWSAVPWRATKQALKVQRLRIV